jgi:hypothetical protein
MPPLSLYQPRVVWEQVKDAPKETYRVRALVDLEAVFSNGLGNIVTAGRTLVKEGPVSRVTSKGLRKACYLHLLSDALLVSQPCRGPSRRRLTIKHWFDLAGTRARPAEAQLVLGTAPALQVTFTDTTSQPNSVQSYVLTLTGALAHTRTRTPTPTP